MNVFDVSLCYNKTKLLFISTGGERNEKIHAVETAEFSFLWHAS